MYEPENFPKILECRRLCKNVSKLQIVSFKSRPPRTHKFPTLPHPQMLIEHFGGMVHHHILHTTLHHPLRTHHKPVDVEVGVELKSHHEYGMENSGGND